MLGPRFVAITVPPPPVAAAPTGRHSRSFRVDTDLRRRPHRTGKHDERRRPFPLSVTRHVVGFARTPTARGGWVASAGGGVYADGDAGFYGSMGAVRPINPSSVLPRHRPAAAIGSSHANAGSSCSATHSSSARREHQAQPADRRATTASPTGRGYWFVASDGGIFSFGDADFAGSTGGSPPGFPVTGMAATPDGRGYWSVTVAGQVFSFGAANYEGNAPLPLAAVVVGIVAAPGGYRIVDARGTSSSARRPRAPGASAAGLPLVGAG